MPREQLPLRPIQVDYKCDKCGEGYMRPDSCAFSVNPPVFHHTCNNKDCDHTENFNERYPTVRYAREAELLDLDNYEQQTL